ncbi:MAG: hypothetical protein ACM30F_04860 [Nitrospirota bacterium]|nr:hypothetical protein [Nitrospirota bacterium]
MDEHTTFLILSRVGESDAIPITGLLDITMPRGIRRDPNLIELLEGKFECRIQLRTGH